MCVKYYSIYTGHTKCFNTTVYIQDIKNAFKYYSICTRHTSNMFRILLINKACTKCIQIQQLMYMHQICFNTTGYIQDIHQFFSNTTANTTAYVQGIHHMCVQHIHQMCTKYYILYTGHRVSDSKTFAFDIHNKTLSREY